MSYGFVHDPFKYADIYEDEWEKYLHEVAESVEDVKECFRQKLINQEQLREGLQFFREKERLEQ